MSRGIEVLQLNAELKDLYYWQNQVLVDKLLRQLHLHVKHGYGIVVLNIEVLVIEEGLLLSAC